MKRRLTSLIGLAASLTAFPAAAQMGMEPGAPQAGNLPGGVSPGVQSQSKDDWRFDFHGFFTMPFWAGFGSRPNPLPGQDSTTWHAPPLVPGERGSFAYTNVMPGPWTQLNFSYGTSVVRGTVIIAAKTASSAAGFFNPPNQVGIKDAFLTLDLPAASESKYTVYAGVFTNRYGTMGEYDEGQYATPIMARVEGAGITGAGRWKLGKDVQLLAEGSAMGNIDKPVLGTIPEGWNGFADANLGATYAIHGHLGASIKEFAHIGVHGFNTFSKDNQASIQQQPDANMNIFGADVRLTMKQFGHLYAGFSHLNATTVGSLGGVVRYLDTINGPDLMRNYLGTNSNGTGKLTTIGAQYDFSLASALLGPEKFSGNAPDLRASAFFMMTVTDTTDTTSAPPNNRYGICNNTCRKFGGEIAYKPLSFLTVAARGDQVDQNTNNGRESFTILTPRLIFSSDWNSQDQIVVQYSRYFYGSEVGVRSPGYDPRDLTYSRADENAVSIHATMWW